MVAASQQLAGFGLDSIIAANTDTQSRTQTDTPADDH